jgi:hypothetical protein
MDNNGDLDMNEFDFNVSGQGNFQGDQNIILDNAAPNFNEIDEKNNEKNVATNTPINNNNNLPMENTLNEKPSSGVLNIPNSKDENLNQNISIATDNEYISKSTLDEPIKTTLKRDLLIIATKVKYVIIPKMTERKIEELYNWDLWGPLIFCFLYSIALSTGNNNSETSIFVLVFAIFWIGGFIITFNEKFLGAQIGICQVLSLLGYGMFPTTVAGVVIGFCKITNIFVKLVLVLVGLVWSVVASVGFFSNLVEPDKKLLAVFPVFLFLFSLSMFALNY